MIKKIISIFLVFIFLFSALSSCSDVPSEDTAPETETIPETSEEIPEEPVLHSFYIRGTGYKEGYVVLFPANDSEEAKQWNRIYLKNYTDGDLCPRPLEGEIIEVIYSGEIEAMPEENNLYIPGYIQNVHYMKIKVDPREYNGVNYGVAILGQGPSGKVIEKHGGMVGEVIMQYLMRIEGMLLASNRDELTYLADNCIIGKVINTSSWETEQMKEGRERLNQRYRLLDVYDDDFFNKNDLLMISIFAGSGSMRFDVTDIVIDSGICTLTVEITEWPATDDIGTWTILVSIPKEVSTTITEYKTYTPTPEWIKGTN